MSAYGSISMVPTVSRVASGKFFIFAIHLKSICVRPENRNLSIIMSSSDVLEYSGKLIEEISVSCGGRESAIACKIEVH